MASLAVTSRESARTEATTTVRVSQDTHAKLRQLASETGRPISAVVEEAAERYRREVFLEKANEEYARLRANDRAWEAERAERQALDGTLKDGLEPEEWSEDDVVPAEEAGSR
jgi:predicted DNA-binding protein